MRFKLAIPARVLLALLTLHFSLFPFLEDTLAVCSWTEEQRRVLGHSHVPGEVLELGRRGRFDMGHDFLFVRFLIAGRIRAWDVVMFELLPNQGLEVV